MEYVQARTYQYFKNMKYKIIKKQYLDKDDNKIKYYYEICELTYTFKSLFTRQHYWTPYKTLHTYPGFGCTHGYKAPVFFEKKKEATEFINKLTK